MAKYKVGDNVRVKQSLDAEALDVYSIDTNDTWLIGKEVEIIDVDGGGTDYEITGSVWWWPEKYLEPLKNTEPAETEQFDTVTKPAHYADGKIETIDFIRDKLTQEEYIGYCTGNVFKYISRWRKKGGVDDLKKARVYLDWAIEAGKEG